MSKLDETFTDASKEYSLLSDTNSRFIRNLHFLLDSRIGLGGLTNLDESFTEASKDSPSYLTPFTGILGTLMFSQTSGRDFEDRWSLDRVRDVGSW